MKILGIEIANISGDSFAEYIKDAVKKDKKYKISKVNTEFLQRALSDRDFSKVLNSSDLNIVDGRGVMWAARYLTIPIAKNKILGPIQAFGQVVYSGLSIVFNPGFIKYPISEAIPGVEAFNIVMSVAEQNQAGVFIFGASENIINLAVNNIKKDFPDLRISGFMNGYDFQIDNKTDPVTEINKTDAKILIVALGSPKQEMWINVNIGKLKHVNIAIGEGGTLDRIANPSQKSPKLINRIGLEWLWRTIFNKSKTETRNRLQKLWNAVPLFIFNVVKWKIRNGQIKI
jgi:N-acetylglucosaminyldiphosphoundecaprenol N-acetyl-beta-D-mannosaminyltransferase